MLMASACTSRRRRTTPAQARALIGVHPGRTCQSPERAMTDTKVRCTLRARAAHPCGTAMVRVARTLQEKPFTQREKCLMVERALVAVVDDDESVRESLPDLLNELGFAVEAF